MSNTPLSDYITKLADQTSDSLVLEFYEKFLVSEVGIILENMPDLEPGSKFTVQDEKITSTLVKDPTGKSLIKVCADPDVFEPTYKAGINALMSGDKVIEMLLKSEGPKGLLVCSAASFNSFPIYIETARKLVPCQAKIKLNRKWWQFWK